ncbi:MAG: hypothetical protein HZA15_13910 [Nitrospirae bacterium]|nr:hypothetical protein [Nitrospirota bacterium]
MNEPIMITCPHCGKETPAGNECLQCRKELGSLQELQVQYRDFKGSEMLDIKMSSAARQGDEKQTLKLVQKKKEAATNAPQSEIKRPGKKTVFFFWATIAIFLSALAWYYLLNFLLK